MPLDTLHQTVRSIYTSTMQRSGSSRLAFKECVGLVLDCHPDWAVNDARKAVAKIIAEDPAYPARTPGP